MKRAIYITILTILTILFLGLISPLSAVAVESTGSAISEEDVKDKIKERLEKTVEKGLETVKGLMVEEKKGQLYAWVGTIESASESKLSIETLSGLKEAEIATNAAIYLSAPGKAKKEIEAEDIEVGQYTLTMGPRDENEIILGKRIIVLDKAPASGDKRDIVSGKVAEIDESDVTIQTNGDSLDLIIGKKIPLKINGIKSPTVEDIQVNDYLTAIVTINEAGKPASVKAVLVVPGKTNPQAEENEVTEEESEATAPAEEESEEE